MLLTGASASENMQTEGGLRIHSALVSLYPCKHQDLMLWPSSHDARRLHSRGQIPGPVTAIHCQRKPAVAQYSLQFDGEKRTSAACI